MRKNHATQREAYILNLTPVLPTGTWCDFTRLTMPYGREILRTAEAYESLSSDLVQIPIPETPLSRVGAYEILDQVHLTVSQ